MQPGNLVFLVIVAIWAVYLVQHWIRRREHVATARSVDRFSEAMRVLERRTPLPRTAAATSSYAVQPVSAGPAVRAPRTSGSTVSPLAAPSSALASAHAPLPGRSPLAARSRLGERAPLAGPSAGSARSAGSGRPPRRSPRELMVRRVRGVAFLITLAAIPVTLVLAVADILLWVSVAIAVAAFVVVVAGLRAAVKRDASVRRAASAAARRRYASPTSRVRDEKSSPAARSHPGAEQVSAPDEVVAEQPAGAAVVSARQTDEVYDVTAYVPRPGEPSTTPWSPIPVPPPTYTLKDSATRPAPAPAEVSQVPVPIEVEDDELERLMAQRHRRVVS